MVTGGGEITLAKGRRPAFFILLAYCRKLASQNPKPCFICKLEASSGGTKSLVELNKSWQSKMHTDDPEQNRHGFSLKEAITAGTIANPFWYEMAVLSKRSMKNLRRQPELFGIRLGARMAAGFILATLYWRLDNSMKGVQEKLGFFAFAITTTFYSCVDAIPIFLQERHIFMRETAHNGYRRSSSYVLAHSLVALPSLIFLSLGFAAITFWAVGLHCGLSGFLFFFLIIFASYWAGSSFVTFLSCVVPHVMVGYTLGLEVIILACFFFLSNDSLSVEKKSLHSGYGFTECPLLSTRAKEYYKKNSTNPSPSSGVSSGVLRCSITRPSERCQVR
ncbi:ABC transporter G family member 6-like [Tripterygium wilfordii]|uniref:ABC transporter G family member 6-like n=1 Tax=Tripterygium wilfordii TaxID=458696 RepID=UPI0018F7FCA1|nr:ABC transporter G family member 6-like [Tripterygium wilfordii]